MTCTCIETVNEKLASRNTRLLEPIFIHGDTGRRLFVETQQIETGRGKAKATSVFTSYCPFCGVEQEKQTPSKID